MKEPTTHTIDPWTQNSEHKPAQSEHWERELIGKIALSAIVEQRRSRRWGIFFKSLLFIYIFITSMIVLQAFYWPVTDSGDGNTRHTAVIKIDGTIASGQNASASRIIDSLRSAFENEATAGIILQINSPGGSPVQAGQVYDEIMRLRKEHPQTPVYAVAADVCASGAYYIAAAAQQIYADKASLVGSIGVRIDSFGFVPAMQKFGIERRLYTAGENKALLDPFSPEQPAQVEHLTSLVNDIHQQFIAAVKHGRDTRLQDHPDLFSGLIWTGEQSVKLGLIDGLGSTRYVAEELIGTEKLMDFTANIPWFQRLIKRFQVYSEPFID